MSKSVVLITGARTGIGRATALAFAKEGARLVVSGRHDDAGHALAGELRDLGVEGEFVSAGGRKDREVILFNNAGVSSTSGEVPITIDETGVN